MSAYVLLMTGPRAAGKSTLAAQVQLELRGSVLLHVDEPFHSVLSQQRSRWNGREIELYAMVLRHQLAFAHDLAALCPVIVDATVLPDQLAPLIDRPPVPVLSVIVLLPPLQECLANEHRPTRTVPVHEEKVRTTWTQMQAWRSVTGISVSILDGNEQQRMKMLTTALQQPQQEL